MTAWLRVPLAWFQSTTFAFLPDETHRSIRRTFSSPFDTNVRRQFCGYCGTQISQWDDSSRETEEFISLTLGSLLEEDLSQLEDLGLLESERETEPQGEEKQTAPQSSQVSLFRPARGAAHRGAPWFESIVEETRLGRIKRQKGGHTSADGTMNMEWEVAEWTSTADDAEEANVANKRKIEDVDQVQPSVDMAAVIITWATAFDLEHQELL